MVYSWYDRYMMTVWVTAVVVVASVLGAGMAIPQALKLVRSRRVEGVSTAWAAMSAMVNVWWAIYGFGGGDWAIIPVSVVSVMAYLAVMMALVRHGDAAVGGVVVRMMASAVAIGVIPLPALWLGGWPAVGVVLGVLYGVQLMPAVVAVYRSLDVSGVSATTWVIGWVEALLWGIYGLAVLDAGLMTMAVVGVAMASAVLARLFVGRPRSQQSDLVPALGLARA